MLSIWIIVIICTATEGEDNVYNLQQSVNDFMAPADQYQEYLDSSLDILEVNDPNTRSGDITLSNDISAILDARKSILLAIKDEVRNEYARLKPDVTYKRCCDVELPHESIAFPGPVNFDEWCVDGDVLNENNNNHRFMSRDIMELFKDKYLLLKDEIRYLYYSTEEGVMFSYPGYRNCDPFDPRIRPWYVEAATSSQNDIIIVLDISGSMRHNIDRDVGDTTYIAIAMEAARTVLDTLNPRDRVSIVAFNSEVYTPGIDAEECYERLVNVTARNKHRLKNFLSGLNPRSDTSYYKALSKAFEIFQNTPQNSNEQDRFILMITDGEPTDKNPEDIYETIKQGNAALNNSVVIFTYGLGPEIADAEEILSNIAAQNFVTDLPEVSPGEYIQVEDPQNLRFQMATFYDTRINLASNEIQYLSPYRDAWDNQIQIPMCVNIRHNYATKGFLCIDSLLFDYFGKVMSYNNDASYAFVIDAHLRTMTHPLLSLPLASNDLVDVLITSLEPDLESYTHDLTSSDTGSIQVPSTIVKSRGDVYSEGVRVERQSSNTYRWFALSDTTYILVTVNSDNVRPSEIRWRDSYNVPCIYHNQDAECSHSSESMLLSSSFMFSRNAFKENRDYLARDNNIARICDHLVNDTFLTIFEDGIREMFASSDVFNRLTRNTGVLYYQLVTLAGLHRVSPRLTVPNDYDPLEESWCPFDVGHNRFHRCMNEKSNVTIGLPEESPFGLNTEGISVCKRLFKNSHGGGLYGAFNVVVRPEKLWDKLTTAIPQCTDRHGCFLVSDAGLMLLHSTWFMDDSRRSEMYQRQHIVYKEPAIAHKLIEDNMMQQSLCIAIDAENGPRQYITWRIQTWRSHIENDGWMLHDIASTNFYLGIKLQHQTSNDCQCSGLSQVSECSENRAGYGMCFCPCYVKDLEWYDPCSGIFHFTRDSPPPCTPESTMFEFNNSQCPAPISVETALSPTTTNQPSPDLSSTDLAPDGEVVGKRNSGSKSQSNDAWVIPVMVVLVAIVLVAVGIIIGCFLCRRRKDEDTYAEMVIPSGLTSDYITPVQAITQPSPDLYPVQHVPVQSTPSYIQGNGTTRRTEPRRNSNNGNDLPPSPCQAPGDLLSQYLWSSDAITHNNPDCNYHDTKKTETQVPTILTTNHRVEAGYLTAPGLPSTAVMSMTTEDNTTIV